VASSWRCPIVGVGAVPLNEGHPSIVVFVCDEAPDGSKRPVGTAFLVGVPGSDGTWWRYFVTAGHVVQDGRPKWIRLRRADGQSVVDEPVGEWEIHPTSDVAATPCELDLSGFAHGFIEDWVFSDRWQERAVGAVPLRIGEEAYFVGLLAEIPTMADRNIPMVRSGRIGAFYQEDIPMISGATTRIEPVAHLLDSYSRGGFSGSPCFVDHPVIDQAQERGLTVSSRVALVGIVVGHFNSPMRDNAGIAVVVPVEAIRELLQTERLVEWRERRDAEAARARAEGRWDNAATADSGVGGPSAFERFKDLTRRLINAPK
jgi:hypothetical protein